MAVVIGTDSLSSALASPLLPFPCPQSLPCGNTKPPASTGNLPELCTFRSPCGSNTPVRIRGKTALSSSSETMACTNFCRVRLWEDRRKGSASLPELGPISPRFHCSQCEGLTPYCTLCRGMAWQATSKARWDLILKTHMDRLGKHAKDVDIHLDYDHFEIYLKDLEKRHAKSGLGRALSPKVMNQIRDFTDAITSFSQVNQFGCITWGTLQLVLKVSPLLWVSEHVLIRKVASAFTSVFSIISEMLAELAMQLPLFEEYRSIFPTAHELEEPLRNLYRAWVDFCIDTVLFFKSSRWGKSRVSRGKLKSLVKSLNSFAASSHHRFAEGYLWRIQRHYQKACRTLCLGSGRKANKNWRSGRRSCHEPLSQGR